MPKFYRTVFAAIALCVLASSAPAWTWWPEKPDETWWRAKAYYYQMPGENFTQPSPIGGFTPGETGFPTGELLRRTPGRKRALRPYVQVTEAGVRVPAWLVTGIRQRRALRSPDFSSPHVIAWGPKRRSALAWICPRTLVANLPDGSAIYRREFLGGRKRRMLQRPQGSK